MKDINKKNKRKKLFILYLIYEPLTESMSDPFSGMKATVHEDSWLSRACLLSNLSEENFKCFIVKTTIFSIELNNVIVLVTNADNLKIVSQLIYLANTLVSPSLKKISYTL